jgi:hypothetical protein
MMTPLFDGLQKKLQLSEGAHLSVPTLSYIMAWWLTQSPANLFAQSNRLAGFEFSIPLHSILAE